jgi:hypothetical protein
VSDSHRDPSALAVIRSRSFRVGTAVLAGVGGYLWAASAAEPAELRSATTAALNSTLLVISVTFGLTTYLFANHIRGPRVAVIDLISHARDDVWTALERLEGSEDAAIADVSNELKDLATLTNTEWFETTIYSGWIRGASRHLKAVEDRTFGFEILHRHILPIQYTVIEIMTRTVMYARATLNLIYIKQTISLFVCVIIITATIHVLPNTTAVNQVVVALACSSIVAILESLVLVFSIVIRSLSVESQEFRDAEDVRHSK